MFAFNSVSLETRVCRILESALLSTVRSGLTTAIWADCRNREKVTPMNPPGAASTDPESTRRIDQVSQVRCSLALDNPSQEFSRRLEEKSPIQPAR